MRSPFYTASFPSRCLLIAALGVLALIGLVVATDRQIKSQAARPIHFSVGRR